MISLLLLIAACEAAISAQVEFHPDSLNDSTFHLRRIRNRRSASITALIGSEAKLKLFDSGVNFSEAKVYNKLQAFRRKVLN